MYKDIMMKVITLYANQKILINKRKICGLGVALGNLMKPLTTKYTYRFDFVCCSLWFSEPPGDLCRLPFLRAIFFFLISLSSYM